MIPVLTSVFNYFSHKKRAIYILLYVKLMVCTEQASKKPRLSEFYICMYIYISNCYIQIIVILSNCTHFEIKTIVMITINN